MKSAISCYGLQFSLTGLQTDQAEDLRREGMTVGLAGEPSREATPAFRLERRGRYFSLYSDETAVAHEQSWPLLKHVLLNRIHSQVWEANPGLTFIRADAIVWGQQAILLPGPSFSGKSSLARALVARGAQVLCESFTPIDEHGEVHAYPLSEESRQGTPLAGVFALSYVPDATLQFSPLTPGRASLTLAGNLADHRGAGGEFLPRFAAACKQARVRVHGLRGEAGPAAEAILQSMSQAGPT